MIKSGAGMFDFMAAPEPRKQELPADALFASVALDRPLEGDLTYRVPPGAEIRPGVRVQVPLGARNEFGVVTKIGRDPGCDASRVRPIIRILDAEPLVTGDLIILSARIAREWACARGQAIAAMLPAALRRDRLRRTESIVKLLKRDFEIIEKMEEKEPDRYRVLRTLKEAGGELTMQELCRATKLSTSPVKTLAKRGFIKLERRIAEIDPLSRVRPVARTTAPELSIQQKAAVGAIRAALDARKHETFLLFGITGSGKTEVYLHALDDALRAGRGGIVLVPEISLTPQTVLRFRERFDDVAVLHSKLTDAERMDQWKRIREGRVRVVVGARSAVFAPVRDLGIIIVDEEHEPSFKQSNAPRYHARDVAAMRGELAGAAVVLGSATPALETWKRALDGKITLLKLMDRMAGGALPPVRIADLRHERARELNLGSNILLTRSLRLAIERALEKKQRTILFLNRRGFAPVLWCSGCGATVQCARCAVSLTFHRRVEKLVCHMCGREAPIATDCPMCGLPRPRLIGAGTERVEQWVARAFRNAHVARMDSDSTTARGSHEDILDRFRRGDIDILVGTQMIAKGLDVPEVTVVGVVDADSTLHIPEYTSSERAFQLVAQVAGRAGRSAHGGEVFVQTSMPAHPAIACAARHDFVTFAAQELREREKHRYPPFVRFIRVLAEHARDERAQEAVESAASAIRAANAPGVELLGPQPAPIRKIKGKSRWHFLIRCDPPESIEHIRDAVAQIALKSFHGIRLTVDVDPAGTM
ncbi:MAG: primosomal protein N' [Planctomycetes bacterium]|nr:primosomal protein N' [Planctomycetota bacterium]